MIRDPMWWLLFVVMPLAAGILLVRCANAYVICGPPPPYAPPGCYYVCECGPGYPGDCHFVLQCGSTEEDEE